MKNKEITFTILITPSGAGFEAVCPAAPALHAKAESLPAVRQQIEAQLYDFVAGQVARSLPLKSDPTIVWFAKIDPEGCLV